MKKNRIAFHVIAMSTMLLGASVSAAPGDGEGPPDFPVTVTNDASNPVVVAGEVTGDVTAEVSGAVDVTSLPALLTTQLNTLIQVVSAISPQPADFTGIYADSQIDVGSSLDDDFGSDVLISLVTISSENDQGTFWLSERPLEDGIFDSASAIRIGQANSTWPHTLVIPFPQPVRARSFAWLCRNTVEDCEVTISVVGTVAN